MTTPVEVQKRVLLFTINSAISEGKEILILAGRKGFQVRILCEITSAGTPPSMRVLDKTLEYVYGYKAITLWLESQPTPGRLATS